MNKWLLGTMFFLLGWVVALVALQVHLLNFTLDITLGNLVQAVSTIALALIVPVLVTQNLDARKRQKEILVGELNGLKSTSYQILTIIMHQCDKQASLEKAEKQALLALFEKMSRLTGHLEAYYTGFDVAQRTRWIENLENAKTSLNNKITGGELFSSDFVPSSAFVEMCTIEQEKYEKAVNCTMLETIRA